MKTPFLVLLAGFALVGCQTQETSAPAETATPTLAKTVPVQRNLAVGATPESVTSGKYFVTLMGVWNGPPDDALLAADSDGSLSRWIACSRIHGPNASHRILHASGSSSAVWMRPTPTRCSIRNTASCSDRASPTRPRPCYYFGGENSGHLIFADHRTDPGREAPPRHPRRRSQPHPHGRSHPVKIAEHYLIRCRT